MFYLGTGFIHIVQWSYDTIGITRQWKFQTPTHMFRQICEMIVCCTNILINTICICLCICTLVLNQSLECDLYKWFFVGSWLENKILASHYVSYCKVWSNEFLSNNFSWFHINCHIPIVIMGFRFCLKLNIHFSCFSNNFFCSTCQ